MGVRVERDSGEIPTVFRIHREFDDRSVERASRVRWLRRRSVGGTDDEVAVLIRIRNCAIR